MATTMSDVDPIFSDPRLARLYDVFDGERDDLDAYLDLAAELGADSILDIGCGTGSFAVLASARGYRVTGVDPAAASLAIARAKPGADAVRWREGSASAAPREPFDLAVMTGNVAQVFLTDHSWAQLLEDAHARVRPGGHLVFETRRVEDRAWERWAHEVGWTTREVPGVGAVEHRLTVTSVEVPLVSFRHTYRFPDDDIVSSDSTLRFRTDAEIRRSLRDAGFTLVDAREAPDRPVAEIVYVARR